MGATSKAGTRSWRRFRALQLLVGLLLLTAAGLKTHQLAAEPLLERGILDSRWFLIAVVEFELFFGLWLLAGLFPLWTWRASIALFAAFASASLYKAISGEASCGCFGRVSVSPWFSFTLDIFFLAGLLLCRPASQGSQRGVGDSSQPGFRLAMVLGMWLLVGVATGAPMASYQPSKLSDVGELLGDGRTIVLEPERWVGKRFPLLDWIETDAPLDRGRWTIVLHRPGCSACEELLARYRKAPNARRSDWVAFVEVPASATDLESMVPNGPFFFNGRLSDSHQWFVQTPVLVLLVHGEVMVVDTSGEWNHGQDDSKTTLSGMQRCQEGNSAMARLALPEGFREGPT